MATIAQNALSAEGSHEVAIQGKLRNDVKRRTCDNTGESGHLMIRQCLGKYDTFSCPLITERRNTPFARVRTVGTGVQGTGFAANATNAWCAMLCDIIALCEVVLPCQI